MSLRNQVRVPIPPGKESLLVTWDAWFGKEYAFSNTGIENYKSFQLSSGDGIWTEVRSRFARARDTEFVSMVDVRFDGGFPGPLLGPNVTGNSPLSPQASEFGIKPETWTRYWGELRPAGEWFEPSVWMADVTRDPVLALDKLLVKPNPDSKVTGWEELWLEYNTSSHYQERTDPARRLRAQYRDDEERDHADGPPRATEAALGPSRTRARAASGRRPMRYASGGAAR